MYRNESIVVRTEIATSPVIDSLKRIGPPLSIYCLGEREGLFFGYQENWRPTGRNLHRVSERLFAAFRRRACFQSLHRRKINFGNAIESRSTLRGAEYLGCDNLGLAAQFRDGQRYMLVLIDFLENINIFGTRVYDYELHVCLSLLLPRLVLY